MAPVGRPSQRLARLAQHLLVQRAAPTPSASSADDDTLALRPVHGLTTADFVQGSAGNTQTEEGIVLSEEERAIGALVAAMEAGIEDFDTVRSHPTPPIPAGPQPCGHGGQAPLYSAGVDEQRLGLALARWREAGHALPRIWTKAGTLVRQEADTALPVPPDAARDAVGRTLVSDYTAQGARLSFAESVARLGLDPSANNGPTLAGLRIHDCPTDQVDIALSSEGMLAGLRELRSEGKIGHVSLGMNANLVAADILRLVRGALAGTFDTLLLAGGYNLLCQVPLPVVLREPGRRFPRLRVIWRWQDGAPVMVEAARRGAVIHNAGSLASGLLAGGFTCTLRTLPSPLRVRRRIDSQAC